MFLGRIDHSFGDSEILELKQTHVHLFEFRQLLCITLLRGGRPCALVMLMVDRVKEANCPSR